MLIKRGLPLAKNHFKLQGDSRFPFKVLKLGESESRNHFDVPDFFVERMAVRNGEKVVIQVVGGVIDEMPSVVE